MKSKTLFVFLFYLSQNTLAQVAPRVYQQIGSLNDIAPNEYRTYVIEEFTYHHTGEIVAATKKYYNADDEILNWTGTFYTYHKDNGLLERETLRRYNQDVDLWITTEWIDHVYDINGCEIETSKTENLGGLFYTYEYERNDNCQITKETLYSKLTTSNDIRLMHVKDKTYFQDGISYQQIHWTASAANGDLRLLSKYEYHYGTDELLENVYAEIHHNLGGYWYERNTDYFYDAHNNETKRSFFFKNDPHEEWVLEREFIYNNEYDDQDRLIKRVWENYEFPVAGGDPVLVNNSGSEKRYHYECLDLVEREEVNYSPQTTYRTDYFYEGNDKCFEIEEESLSLSIFPNPSAGGVTINSPLLISGNTLIRIFDLSGKLVLEENEFKRAVTTELNLVDLPNGMYMIQLMNQDHFVQDKLLISK